MAYLSPLYIVNIMALSTLYILDCSDAAFLPGFDHARRFSTMSDAISAAEILCAYTRCTVKLYLGKNICAKSTYIGSVSIRDNRPYFCTAEPYNPHFIKFCQNFS